MLRQSKIPFNHRFMTQTNDNIGKPPHSDQASVYKILTPGEFEETQRQMCVPPSALDQQDGFVHLSTAETMIETANLHFTAHDTIITLELDPNKFAGELKWEAAAKRNHMLFPHLYGTIPLSSILSADKLEKQDNHQFSNQGPVDLSFLKQGT